MIASATCHCYNILCYEDHATTLHLNELAHSFPTRRSSDLPERPAPHPRCSPLSPLPPAAAAAAAPPAPPLCLCAGFSSLRPQLDRSGQLAWTVQLRTRTQSRIKRRLSSRRCILSSTPYCTRGFSRLLAPWAPSSSDHTLAHILSCVAQLLIMSE